MEFQMINLSMIAITFLAVSVATVVTCAMDSKADIHKKIADYDKLLEDYEKLTKEHEELKAEHQKLQEKNEQDIKDYNELVAEHNKLIDDNEQDIKDYNDLTAEFNTLVGKVEDLEKRNKTLYTTCGDLKRKVAWKEHIIYRLNHKLRDPTWNA